MRCSKNEDLKFERAWAEVSGPVERIMKRSGATPIPNSLASALTGKEILEFNDDGYHYTRLIAGHPHEKVIYGCVKITSDLAQKLEDQGIKLHELPPNVQLKK